MYEQQQILTMHAHLYLFQVALLGGVCDDGSRMVTPTSGHHGALLKASVLFVNYCFGS